VVPWTTQITAIETLPKKEMISVLPICSERSVNSARIADRPQPAALPNFDHRQNDQDRRHEHVETSRGVTSSLSP
jgi:hypothetical protein